jgi:alcohol-forming fatty acyl-CoA reductase
LNKNTKIKSNSTVAGGKGVMRSMLCEADFTAEVIPVDQAISGLIGIAYTVASMKTKFVET